MCKLDDSARQAFLVGGCPDIYVGFYFDDSWTAYQRGEGSLTFIEMIGLGKNYRLGMNDRFRVQMIW